MALEPNEHELAMAHAPTATPAERSLGDVALPTKLPDIGLPSLESMQFPIPGPDLPEVASVRAIDNGPVIPSRSLYSHDAVSRQVSNWARNLLEKNPVVLDTETTGLEGVAIQVAVVDVQENQVLFNSMIRPSEPIEEGATQVHGIWNEDVANAPTFADVAPQLAEVLQGRTIVAYNASFDRAVLERTAEREGLPSVVAADQHWACLMEAVQTATSWPKGQKLTEVVDRLGIFRQTAHDALGDAGMASSLLQSMAKGSLMDRPGYAPMADEVVAIESWPKDSAGMYGVHLRGPGADIVPEEIGAVVEGSQKEALLQELLGSRGMARLHEGFPVRGRVPEDLSVAASVSLEDLGARVGKLQKTLGMLSQLDGIAQKAALHGVNPLPLLREAGFRVELREVGIRNKETELTVSGNGTQWPRSDRFRVDVPVWLTEETDGPASSVAVLRGVRALIAGKVGELEDALQKVRGALDPGSRNNGKKGLEAIRDATSLTPRLMEESTLQTLRSLLQKLPQGDASFAEYAPVLAEQGIPMEIYREDFYGRERFIAQVDPKDRSSETFAVQSAEPSLAEFRTDLERHLDEALREAKNASRPSERSLGKLLRAVEEATGEVEIEPELWPETRSQVARWLREMARGLEENA